MVMEDVESRIIESSPTPVKVWKRYVDDTFCILKRSEESIFFDHINGIQDSIKFTKEIEKNKAISFLDVLVIRQSDGRLTTDVYRKPTHTNRYLNFRSCHPLAHKLAVIRTLLHRAHTIPSNRHLTNIEVGRVKESLVGNGYPSKMIHIRDDDNGSSDERPSWKGFACLPYVPCVGEKIKRILTRAGVRVAFKPITTLRHVLTNVKDSVPLEKKKGVVYKIPCGDCKLCYVGESKRSFGTRCNEHKKDVARQESGKSALVDHAVNENHTPDWDKFEILETETDFRKRRFLETYQIAVHVNAVNKKDSDCFPTVYRCLTDANIK